MNQSILGGILAAISLLVIYGASASNRVTGWVDGDRASTAQTNNPQGLKQSDGTLVALNSTEASGDGIVDVSGMTPLEKAGTLPKRQTVGEASNVGGTPATPNTDDTEGEVVEANPPAETPTPPANSTENTQPTPAPAVLFDPLFDWHKIYVEQKTRPI